MIHLLIAATIVASPAQQSFDCDVDDCGKTPRIVVVSPETKLRRYKKKIVAPYKSWTNAVASCESGGRWHIATGNGFYGGLQFTLSSWQAVGGVGMPHLASRLEQRFRAVKLLHVQGYGAWPICG